MVKKRLMSVIGYAVGGLLLLRRAEHRDAPPRQADPVAPPLPERPQVHRKPSTSVVGYAKRTWQEFSNDDCMTQGAALAYNTVFSLAPLLLTIIGIAGLVLRRDVIENQIQSQIQALIGSGAGDEIKTILRYPGSRCANIESARAHLDRENRTRQTGSGFGLDRRPG